MQGPPYFDWRLDRWKIGLALLLCVGLFVFLPAQPPAPDPQGASPIARPGQRPVVGGSTKTDLIKEAQRAALTPSPLETPRIDIRHGITTAQNSSALAPLTLAIVEPGPGPLTNSTPLFYIQTEADGLVEIRVGGEKYTAFADSNGYRAFMQSVPLPVGMTWVQARLIQMDGTPLSATVSQIVLIGPQAQPVSQAGIITPFPLDTPWQDSTPLLTGIGPPEMGLIFYAQTDSQGEARSIGEATVNTDGTWRWQMSTPLPSGQTTLWVVVVDDEGTPLSRSWPVTLDVADDAAPTVLVGTTR